MYGTAYIPALTLLNSRQYSSYLFTDPKTLCSTSPATHHRYQKHILSSWFYALQHEHRIQPALKLGHTQAAYRKPRRFKGFGLRKMPKLHPHMHSYLECHVFESHRRYQNGAPQRYAPEKPRRCLGFYFSERVRGANGLP